MFFLVAHDVAITRLALTVLTVIVIPAMSTDVDNAVQRLTLPVTVPRMDRTLTNTGARNAVLRILQVPAPRMDPTVISTVAPIVVITNSAITVLTVFVMPAMSTNADSAVQRPTLPVTVPRMDRM